MNTRHPAKRPVSFCKISVLLVVLGLTLESAPALAQAIYAARVSGTNWTSPWWEIQNGGTPYNVSLGFSTGPGLPARDGSFYHTANTMVPGQGFGCQLQGDIVPGHVYLIEVTIPVINSSADLIMSLSSTNGTLGAYPTGGPLITTPAFRGAVSGDRWGVVGFITNHPGTLHPAVEFRYVSGSNNRSYADGIRFTAGPCSIAPVLLPGPLTDGDTEVTVTGVGASARAVTIYQKMGPGFWIPSGQLTSGIVAGTNVVPLTTPLVRGAQVMATHAADCESVPSNILWVGLPALHIRFSETNVILSGASSGNTVILQKTLNLTEPSTWTPLQTNTPGPNFEFTVPFASPAAFFRIQSY